MGKFTHWAESAVPPPSSLRLQPYSLFIYQQRYRLIFKLSMLAYFAIPCKLLTYGLRHWCLWLASGICIFSQGIPSSSIVGGTATRLCFACFVCWCSTMLIEARIKGRMLVECFDATSRKLHSWSYACGTYLGLRRLNRLADTRVGGGGGAHDEINTFSGYIGSRNQKLQS